MSERHYPTHDVYVANLPSNATATDLRKLGSVYGGVVHATVVVDQVTGQPKGFGFIRYRTSDEAERAIKGLNEVTFHYHRLRANWGIRKAAGHARPERDRPQRRPQRHLPARRDPA